MSARDAACRCEGNCRRRERERERVLCTEGRRRNLEHCRGLITELSTLLEATYRRLSAKRTPGGGRGRNGWRETDSGSLDRDGLHAKFHSNGAHFLSRARSPALFPLFSIPPPSPPPPPSPYPRIRCQTTRYECLRHGSPRKKHNLLVAFCKTSCSAA